MRRVWADKPLRSLAIISLLASVLACATIAAVATSQGKDSAVLTGDAKGYVLLARNLIEQGVLSFSLSEPYVPDSFRAPGYPLFLAGLFVVLQDWLLVALVQAALASVAAVLLYLLLRPYHERAAWWGSLVFALEPVRLVTASTLLSDSLFVVLFLSSLLLLSRCITEQSWRAAALAGAVLGLAILVRPIAQFLPLFFAGYLFWKLGTRRAAKLSAILVFACAVVLGPWAVRNHALFDSWNISSVGPYNLAAYNAPECVKYRPSPEGEATLRAFKERQESLPPAERLSLARAGEFSGVFFAVIRGRELDYAF
ncbi:MAG: glycosyltransferase family 39 protein, partial [Patescibacteria group bacterium]